MDSGAEVQTGKHLAATLVRPGAIISLLVLAGGAAAAGAAAGGAAPAAGAAGAVALVWFLVVLAVATGRAKGDFYAAFAEQRGLSWTTSGAVPPSTELLRRGTVRRADHMFSGKLAGELEGAIVLYTYEVGQGQGQSDEYHHFTVVLIKVPFLDAKVRSLFVQRRVGFRFLDGAEDVFRATERIELESEELDRRCEIFADPSSDDNWLRQLFSPSFVDFLAEQTPEGFAFEVEEGMLCVNVNRHRRTAKELNELSEAAVEVAGRLREEAAEDRLGSGPLVDHPETDH